MEVIFTNTDIVSKILLLIGMIQLHIVDDYMLQGILASLKQKQWWEKNYPQELYKNDYKIALLTHAFSWSFMIMIIPVLVGIYTNNISIVHITVFIVNWIIHAFVDNKKANDLVINLWHDQLLHISQIVMTWILLVVL